MFSIKFITIYIVNRCPENQDFRTFSGISVCGMPAPAQKIFLADRGCM